MFLPNDILLIIIEYFSDEIVLEILKNFKKSNEIFNNIFSNEQQFWKKKITGIWQSQMPQAYHSVCLSPTGAVAHKQAERNSRGRPLVNFGSALARPVINNLLNYRDLSHIDIPLGFFYMKMKKSICYECNKKTVRKFFFYDILLCKNCETKSLTNSNKYRKITKTDAKEDFYLNDNDLGKIQSNIIKNPFYSGYMTLYLYTDIVQLANNKYDNFEKYKIEKKIISDEKRIKRSENQRLRSKNRKSELINELNKYGLSLRNDSKLCYNYINIKKKKLSLQQVVHEMCIMKFLYDYTNYEERKNNYYIEYDYYNGWVDMSQIISDIKEEIRQEINGWPRYWPWLKEKNKISENFSFLKHSIDNELKLVEIWKKYKANNVQTHLKQKEFYNKLFLEFPCLIYKKSAKYLQNVEFI